MLDLFTNPDTWLALLQICIINIVLSGDNAVVIALACRSLPPKQAKTAFMIGAVGIIVLRVGLTAVASLLLDIPFVSIVGSVLLVWIAVKLFASDEDDQDLEGGSHFWEAVRIIIIADIVMSLDNVLGVAAVAKGHTWMLILGMVITVPLILFGSALIMRLMDRFPLVIPLGAALLGYVAGEMLIGDPAISSYIATNIPMANFIFPLAGAALVFAIGKFLERRNQSSRSEQSS
jgi:YjbE family integral membrane protein